MPSSRGSSQLGIKQMSCALASRFFTTSATWEAIYNLFKIVFHYGLSQDTESSSPLYTAGPCSSILYVCTCYSQTPGPSPTSLLSLGNHQSVPYSCETFCFVAVRLYHILDSTCK